MESALDRWDLDSAWDAANNLQPWASEKVAADVTRRAVRAYQRLAEVSARSFEFGGVAVARYNEAFLLGDLGHHEPAVDTLMASWDASLEQLSDLDRDGMGDDAAREQEMRAHICMRAALAMGAILHIRLEHFEPDAGAVPSIRSQLRQLLALGPLDSDGIATVCHALADGVSLLARTPEEAERRESWTALSARLEDVGNEPPAPGDGYAYDARSVLAQADPAVLQELEA